MAEDDLAELVATAEAFEGSRVVGAVEHLVDGHRQTLRDQADDVVELLSGMAAAA